MTSKRKFIIDTDPGVDDVLALLLALTAASGDDEILLISTTYGNVPVQSTLRNVLTMFSVINNELQWRKSNGLRGGFDCLTKHRPMVAVGADTPLEDQRVMADYFHGEDGLQGTHASHPMFSPQHTWDQVLSGPPPTPPHLFTPSPIPAPDSILDLLRTHPPDTITLIALGPLTNIALAAALDPATLLRAKEVIVMGGAISVPGNVTPVAEFNFYADPIAAARVLALTSAHPQEMLPPLASTSSFAGYEASTLGATNSDGTPRRLRLTLVPVDCTNRHLLQPATCTRVMGPLTARGSPLATWVGAFMGATIEKITTLCEGEPALELHDPLCVWYALQSEEQGWGAVEGEDIRVEALGQWTKGMCMVDGRGRIKGREGEIIKGDNGGWLTFGRGNRVKRLVESGVEKTFEEILMRSIFG